MSLVEGHAVYVADQFMKAKPGCTGCLLAPLALPFLLFSFFRNKLKQSYGSRKVIEAAYNDGISMGVLFSRPPNKDYLSQPDGYLSRISQQPFLHRQPQQK